MKEKLEKERKALVNELGKLGGVIRGTIIFSKRKCGSKNCECQRKKSKMHPFRYLSTATGAGRNKIVYVKEAEMPAFAAAIEQYRRIKEIIEKLSALNIQLLKSGAEHEE